MGRPSVLWTIPMALGLTFCTLRDLDYLRDPACAPECGLTLAQEAGATEASIAPAGPADAGPSSDAASEPCGTDGGYREAVTCDRPLAYWRLDDPGPPQALDDVSGGPVGAYIAGADGGIVYRATGALAGDPNRAIHLDGTGWVSAGDVLAFPGRADFSLEAWVSPEGDNYSYRRIVERLAFDGEGHPHDGYILYNQATVAVERWVDGGQAVAAGPPLGNLAYNHIVATFDGTTLRLYVNGSLTQSTPATDPAIATPGTVFYIAGDPGPGTGWVGSIDEIAVYDHALAPDRVTAHYHAGHGP
jgi:hypothetical protein